ncbi:anti-sigma factor antagonist [Streptomyces poonensis]|uniref:Anti-sigma factor antagonist n=1 Tax=Streptomyces poonensis TaxID=68255 RepID=A0A918PCU8_9ACTN|nr:anti-sigma factor antagonist [Streptomyces poonensis]GGZ00257.1 hypothetical protein GCM10010365_18790 [Streptomyces poonensis]GLJ92133.1 hypothetical protein GCM10017589_47420 [Streptomyces poonensis]
MDASTWGETAMPESVFSERSTGLGAGAAGCPEPGGAVAWSRSSELSVESRPDGDRVLVVVSGELDIDTDQMLQRVLRDALGRSVRGVDLDLTRVGFSDCSGLNVVLAMRRRALGDGKTVAIRAASPAVERLLEVTGTRSLFEVSAVPAEAAGQDGCDSDEGDNGLSAQDLEELRIEVVQLRRAMQTRPTIDLARGVLMASFRLSPEDAWHVLVTVSQRANVKLHRLAHELVGTVRGGPLPANLQGELGSAVAALRSDGEPSAGTGARGDGVAEVRALKEMP